MRAEPIERARRVLEGIRERSGRGEALVEVAGERLRADLVERARDLRVDAPERGDGLVEESVQRLSLGLGLEEPPAGEHFPQADAHREHVRAAVDFLGPSLLGRHVRDLALELARPGHREARGGPGDAEIRDAGDAVDADQDVVRRHVAVHDLERPPLVVGPFVSGVEPGERVEHDAHGHAGRDGLLLLRGAVEEVPGRVPLDVLHDEVVASVGRADLEDGDDVGVMDPRRQARFVEEHLDELGVPRQVLVQPLDRVEPLEAPRPAEAREKDRPHSPARELSDQLEPIELRSNHLRHDDEAPRLGGDP